ncbi:MAG: DUF2318 domain-containing protein [Oscillospiraceae bacterium]|nr:DUF2318 domain-containing protein [Oscillospiraceae bacterium]
MLKYFVDTTEALLTAGLLTGLIAGFAKRAYGKRGSIPLLIAAALGLLAAARMAYLKNTTRKIDTSLWNLRIFRVSLAALGAFFVLAILTAVMYGIGKRAAKAEKPTGFQKICRENGPADTVLKVLAASALGIIVFGLMLYLLPDVFSNPYIILMTEKTVVSSAFLLKTIGILFGVLAVSLAGLAVCKVLLRLPVPCGAAVLSLALISNALRQAANCLRIMQTKRMITRANKHYHDYFEIIKFTSNHDELFTYAAICIALAAPILLLIRSFLAKESYSNPAQHRKIRRKHTVSRRWSAFSVLCAGFAVFTMTKLHAVANRKIDLAPIESCIMDDNNLYIPFEQVADGHLHRFAYTTPDNVQIRVIVIKKPNSSAYGIGLDACDICGETGYYEKGGQVVCKLCDVVMNINTIGFKGGCNPIVIPYSIENGQIVIPFSGLVEHKKEFQ